MHVSSDPPYTLNNIGSYRVLLGLHGDCTEGLFLKNLYCLECNVSKVIKGDQLDEELCMNILHIKNFTDLSVSATVRLK